MTRSGRRLSPEEAALWARVATTVAPLNSDSRRKPEADGPQDGESRPEVPRPAVRSRPIASSLPPPVQGLPPRRPVEDRLRTGLDASWERKLSRGLVQPDFTLDLHGSSLDAAHGRLLHGLSQGKAMGARLVLVITGKPRPVDAADRGNRRGAIRAKIVDWLAASDHALDIAAIRQAHRRHGGSGALYVVLKRRRS